MWFSYCTAWQSFPSVIPCLSGSFSSVGCWAIRVCRKACSLALNALDFHHEKLRSWDGENMEIPSCLLEEHYLYLESGRSAPNQNTRLYLEPKPLQKTSFWHHENLKLPVFCHKMGWVWKYWAFFPPESLVDLFQLRRCCGSLAHCTMSNK